MLSAVIGAAVIAVSPAPVGAAQGELQLVTQSFNVASDGQLTATVALPTNLVNTDLSTADVVVTVYVRIDSRETLARFVGPPTALPSSTDTVTIPPTGWTAPRPGQLSWAVPMEIDAASPTALTISDAGLYPVTIAVVRDGSTLGSLLTFVNRLPATTGDLDPMPVAVAIGTHSAVHVDSKAVTTLDDTAAVAEMTSLADALDALDATTMRATVRLTPAVLAGLQQLSPALFARLKVALPKQQIIAEPRWPLDPSAAAAASQESLYTSWLRAGEDSLAALVPTPISRSMAFVDQSISAKGATLRRNLGARMMVMTPTVYDSLDGSIGKYSDYTGQLVAANLPNDTPFDAAIVDRIIADLLAHPLHTTTQTTIYVVAHLLALRQGVETTGGLAQRHAVVIATPDIGVPDAGLIGSIASLIDVTPGLTPSSLDEVSLRADRILINGEERPVVLPAVDGEALSRRVFAQATVENGIGDVASMLPTDDERPNDWRLVADVLPTTALDDASAQSLVTTINSEIAAIKSAVQVPAPYTVNLPGRSSTVRVSFLNKSDVPLKIKVQLSSPPGKLIFTNDDQPVVLEPGIPKEIRIKVEARSNGTSGVSLDVFMPNDVRLAPTVPLTFRVNALGVGNVLTIGLFGLVLLWWLQHVRSTRRRRRQVSPATVPAS